MSRALLVVLLASGVIFATARADTAEEHEASADPPGRTSAASSTGPKARTYDCSVTRSGGTGDEPGGVIPVCCRPSASEKAQLDELLLLLNRYRAEKGKAPLVYDGELEAAMQGHCEHMVAHGFFDHTAPEAVVAQPNDRAKLCGTTAVAENLASGQSSPEAVMAAWKGSPGHERNMLGSWKRVGMGRAGPHWGQLFGM